MSEFKFQKYELMCMRSAPTMELRWQRVAYLASDSFSFFEHAHDIPIDQRRSAESL
jgi:hypothetical protein